LLSLKLKNYLTPIKEQQNYNYETTATSNVVVTQHKTGNGMHSQKDVLERLRPWRWQTCPIPL